MKKLLITLTLIFAGFAAVTPQAAPTIGKLNWLSGDTGIVLRGGMGPAGSVIGRPSSGDTLGWIAAGTGTVTSVTGTTPIVSSGGNTPAISIGGLTTNGTSGYVVTSTGSGWQYEATNGTSSIARINNTTFSGTTGANNIITSIFTAQDSAAFPSSVGMGANNFSRSGAHNLTLTTTANSNVTFPTTGTLATLAGTETFSNKTFSGLTTMGTVSAYGSGGSPSAIPAILQVHSTDAYSTGKGAAISGGGKYTGAGAYTEWGSVYFKKQTNVDGEYGGGISLMTRANGDTLISALDLLSDQSAVFKNTVTASVNLNVTGTSTLHNTTVVGSFGAGTSGGGAYIQLAGVSDNLGFFDTEGVTQKTIGSLTAYNPVTQTASFMTQYQALLSALGNASGYGLVKP